MRLLTILFALSLFPTSHLEAQRGAPVPPTTAKPHFANALAEARKWQADAILTQVNGTSVGADGKLAMWTFGSYSPAKKTCAIVYAANKEAHLQPTGDTQCEKAELKITIDSDVAMATARATGITKPKSNMAALVEKGKAVWMVLEAGGMKPGDLVVTIDATTGAVTSKSRM